MNYFSSFLIFIQKKRLVIIILSYLIRGVHIMIVEVIEMTEKRQIKKTVKNDEGKALVIINISPSLPVVK